MTITADARSSASTAAGRPTSSRPSDDAPRTDVVSPYGTAPSAPGDPHGGAQTADSRGPEPDAVGSDDEDQDATLEGPHGDTERGSDDDDRARGGNG